MTMLKNRPFLSYQQFKKGTFLKKVRLYFFIKLAIFAHFLPKTDFLLSDHLF